MNTELFNRLLREIHNGDMGALEPIYNAYYKKMVLSARYVLHNSTDAQDAASQALVKLADYAKYNAWPCVRNANVYVSRTARNAAIDLYNARKNFVRLDALRYLPDEKSSEEKADDAVLFRQALESVSGRDYDVALMFYVYGCKIKEISREWNLPVGTVKWILSEVRRKMKVFLKK